MNMFVYRGHDIVGREDDRYDVHNANKKVIHVADSLDDAQNWIDVKVKAERKSR